MQTTYTQAGLSQHKTLQGRWVFYDRLAEDDGGRYRKLHDVAKGNLLEWCNIDNRAAAAATNLRTIAVAERKKEIALLQEIFGNKVVFDLDSPTIEKDMVQCFNSFLNLSSVFERNLEQLLGTEGQKTVMSWFPGYFKEVFETYKPELIEKTKRILVKDIDSYLEQLDSLIEEIISKAAMDALLIMTGEDRRGISGAKQESGVKGDYNKAYKEFSDALQLLPANNKYVKQIMDIYGLTKLKDDMVKKAKKKKPTEKDLGNIKINTSDIHSKAGNFVEVVREAMINLCANGIKDLKIADKQIQATVTSNIKAVRMGELNIRDDLVVGVGFSSNVIEDFFRENTPLSASKQDSIQYMKKLNDELQQHKNTFIIHTSSKNYSVNKDFMSRGGYGTIKMNLATFEETLAEAHLRSTNIVTAIMQTVNGAIGHGENIKKNLEDSLSEYFGQILFDDVATIGSSMARQNNKSIHIMDLQQMEIPLSVFLFAMADAFEVGSNRDFVSIRITPPQKILYETMEEQISAFPNNSIGAWKAQREDSLNKTEITTHFFKKIKDFMQNFK